LTEYQIAIDVLGRRKDFSLTDDSTVRNRAYELRQRLEKFYSTEHPGAAVRIEIPRGGYIPYFTRHQAAVAAESLTAPSTAASNGEIETARPVASQSRRLGPWVIAALLVGLIAGSICTWLLARPHPPAILKEAWGPLAVPGDEMLLSIATNFHMMVRPHIAMNRWRLPAPKDILSVYGEIRPLEPGEPLYMEPAQLSVPLAELAGAAALTNLRTAFGGAYQILPESEAPVAALRGRNSVLIGSGTNSQAAHVLLKNLPYTIDYTDDDRFAVFDQRKPAGQNKLFVTQTVGQPVPSVGYGLLSVLTALDSSGAAKRTVVLSGSSSAGVQGAVEFFCSPAHMRELKERFLAAGLNGFPSVYQVVVRCRTSGVRLITYEYAGHEVVQR
jgi:hypothetical protein